MARGRKKGIVTKKHKVKSEPILKHKEIIFSDKPNCPGCQTRDYQILDYDLYKDTGKFKFKVKCNNCKLHFEYVKEIKMEANQSA